MNALAQPATPEPLAASVPLLRTLVLCDLVDSTALVERLGDQRAADLFRKHDRLARSLIQQHGGREIDKTDGFLLMFDRPIQAVAFALAYQRELKQLGVTESTPLSARLGIHVGDVLIWDNAPDDVAKGAKQVEVEGLVKPITSRLMQLALPNQILLSGVAYSLAHRAQGELGAQLETVRWRTHGRYRFKGIPDPIPVFEVGDEGHAPLKAPPWSGKAHREVPFWRRPATMGIEIGLLLMLLAIPAWYLLKPEPAIAFANRDWVVVGDLKNLTGEPSFDDAIDTAFRIGLEQSRYVNVLSDLKTRETVQLMQQDPDKIKVDRAIGSEIALRDGARALILPTVAEIGGRVRVTAEVIDPTTQTTVYSESADGVGADSVLLSLDKVNQKLRLRLGEALATVSQEARPLAKVTTNNLEALRAYSLGVNAYAAHKNKDAEPLLAQAIKLDPDFTLARISMARLLFTMDRNRDAIGQLEQANTKRDRLSSKDALYLDAWRTAIIAPASSLEKWRVIAGLYPDFFAASGSYAFFSWISAGAYDNAIEAAKKSASDRNPHRGLSHQVLGTLYLTTEHYPEAVDSFKKAIAEGITTQNEYYSATFAAQRRFVEAVRMLKEGISAGAAQEDIDTDVVRIAFPADQGKTEEMMRATADALRRAESINVRELRKFRSIDLTLQATFQPADKALQDSLRRHLIEGISILKASRDEVDRADTEFEVALVGYLAAHIGDEHLAQTALQTELSDSGKGSYPVLDQMLSIARAEILRAQKKPGDAIALLRSQISGNEIYMIHVALLDAYVDAKKSNQALEEGQWLLEHRGRAYGEYNGQRELTPMNVVRSDLALLTMAEINATANKPSAQKSLDAFRAAWPEAAQHSTIAPRVQEVERVLGREN